MWFWNIHFFYLFLRSVNGKKWDFYSFLIQLIKLWNWMYFGVNLFFCFWGVFWGGFHRVSKCWVYLFPAPDLQCDGRMYLVSIQRTLPVCPLCADVSGLSIIPSANLFRGAVRWGSGLLGILFISLPWLCKGYCLCCWENLLTSLFSRTLLVKAAALMIEIWAFICSNINFTWQSFRYFVFHFEC